MQSKRVSKLTPQEVWVELGEQLRRMVPHLYSVLSDEENFVELRIKARPDGTTLAVLKKYDMDGGPLVCFGSGYGATGSLIAINSTINSGNWKVDKPWSPESK